MANAPTRILRVIPSVAVAAMLISACSGADGESPYNPAAPGGPAADAGGASSANPSAPVDDPTLDDATPDGELDVLTKDEAGNVTVTVHPLTVGDKRAMLVERGLLPPSRANTGSASAVGTSTQAVYLRSSPCPGTALWIYDRANGWATGSGANMMCADLSKDGSNDMCSPGVVYYIGWPCNGIKAIWAGTDAGQLSPNSVRGACATGTGSGESCATWNANDAAKNVSCATNGRYLDFGVCMRLPAGASCMNTAECSGSNKCVSGVCSVPCSLGASCKTGKYGACSAGTVTACSPTKATCTASMSPTTEVCDGIDNDCDGSTDEGIASTSCKTHPAACDPRGLTFKVPGHTQCTNGATQCVATEGKDYCVIGSDPVVCGDAFGGSCSSSATCNPYGSCNTYPNGKYCTNHCVGHGSCWLTSERGNDDGVCLP